MARRGRSQTGRNYAMRMAKFTRTHRVRPWGGTTEDVARVAREAQRLVSDATGEELTLSLNVTRPGRQDQYDSPDEFKEDVGGDLRSIQTIYTRVSPAGYPEKVSVVVIFYKGRAGAWLSVEGTSEVSVRGVALALQTVLEEGRRRARWVLPIAWALLVCSWLPGGLAIAGVGEGREHGPHTVNQVLAITGLVLAVLGLLALGVWWLAVPGMELKRVGEPTRLQMLLGRPLKWLLGVLALATITAVIGVILTKIV
jgi:hypothetical protein